MSPTGAAASDVPAVSTVPPPVPTYAMAASGPPGGWENFWQMLTGMNTGVQNLQTEMKSVGNGLTGVKKELADFKTEITGKVAELERQHKELAEETENRLVDFKNEVRDELDQKWREWKAELKDEIMSELRTEIGSSNGSLVSPQIPNSTIAAKFQHLLKLSRSLESNFCMGQSKMKKPTVCAHVVLRQFFPEFDLSIAGKKDDVLIRFSVSPSQSGNFRAKLQEVRGAILTYGWWVAQENPADLRAMYTHTNEFLKFAKGDKQELKRFFLTIESGWVFFREIPLVPVFLVPADTTEWDVLSGLLLNKLKSVNSVGWLDRASESPQPDNVFLGKWLEAMKLRKELADALVPLFNQQDGGDVTMSDLGGTQQTG